MFYFLNPTPPFKWCNLMKLIIDNEKLDLPLNCFEITFLTFLIVHLTSGHQEKKESITEG